MFIDYSDFKLLNQVKEFELTLGVFKLEVNEDKPTIDEVKGFLFFCKLNQFILEPNGFWFLEAGFNLLKLNFLYVGRLLVLFLFEPNPYPEGLNSPLINYLY